MSNLFAFNCGCTFEIKGRDSTGKPLVDYQPQYIDFNCPATWELISSGNTKGVFQLESRLGQMMAKKLKPTNMEELAALITILRPGTLESLIVDEQNPSGKSVTLRYIDRKNKVETVTSYHPSLDHILADTYQMLLYQEQCMSIVKHVAGFNLQQAHTWMKAAGKKKPEIMAKVKTEYMEGVEKTKIVNTEDGEMIWNGLEKFQRYGFNKSHAVEYAMNSYTSAFIKTHFPETFFTAYLRYAKFRLKPQEEICALVNNAKLMGIEVNPPDFRRLNSHFKSYGNEIVFGLSSIKGVGESVIKKIRAQCRHVEDSVLKKPAKDWSWMEFLIYYSPNVNKTAIKALINSGSLSYMKLSRYLMNNDYDKYSELTDKEQKWIENNYKKEKTLEQILKLMLSAPVGRAGGISNARRVPKVESILKLVQNPPESMKDDPEWIAGIEAELLGIPLTCTVVDKKDTRAANCTCLEFAKGHHPKDVAIAVKIDAVKETKTKRGAMPGQEMAFLTISDITAVLESVVLFPEQWEDNKNICIPGNTVIVVGELGNHKDSLVVKKIIQI